MDHGELHLRSIKHVEAGQRHLTVVSNLPITSELLQRASRVGSVDLYPPDQDINVTNINVTKPAPLSSAGKPTSEAATGSFRAPRSLAAKPAATGPQNNNNVEAGLVAPAATSFDPSLPLVDTV